MDEEWRDIPGYEGYYQASSLGRVRSVARVIRQNAPGGGGELERRMPGTVLKPCPAATPDKRPLVSLSRGGDVKKRPVHILVALAFVGLKPAANSYCCHIDGDVHNNTPGNLYWGDAATNSRDAIRHGTHWASSKTECPHGHLLIRPNLREGRLRAYGHRACRSCGNAYEWAEYRRLRGLPVSEAETREYADNRYAEMMCQN